MIPYYRYKILAIRMTKSAVTIRWWLFEIGAEPGDVLGSAPKVAKWYAGDGLDHPSVFLAKTLASYLVAGSKSGKLHFPFQIILLSLWAGTVKISHSPSSDLQLSSNSLIGVWLSEVHSSKKVLASMPWASLLKLAKPANPENHANVFFCKIKMKATSESK